LIIVNYFANYLCECKHFDIILIIYNFVFYLIYICYNIDTINYLFRKFMNYYKNIAIMAAFSLLFMPFISFAQNGQAGVHKPGTGRENPEGKQKGQAQTQQSIQAGEEVPESQSEPGQIQNQNKEIEKSQGDGISALRRNKVAKAAQALLEIAEGNQQISPNISAIAQIQEQNQDQLEAGLSKVQSRGAFIKFFIGPNYKEINKARRSLRQRREQIDKLNQLKDNLADEADRQSFTEQIKELEQVDSEIESMLGTAQKGFSLFGWLNNFLAQ
jgi:hypothetical protein